MRFLFYSYNYYPEKTGIGKYNGEWAEWLTQEGHEVVIITGRPYYPEWSVYPNYRNRFWETEFIRGVKVIRCPMFIPSKPSGLTRILSDLSFLISSSWSWIQLAFKPKFDVVISIYPPLTSGLFPYLYVRTKGGLWIHHVQDLQVDAAVKLGIINNRFIANTLYSFEHFFFKRANIVSSISEGMKSNIIEKGVSKDRYLMLENWVDTDFIYPLSYNSTYPLRKTLGIADSAKVILYSGNLGEKQGLEVIIEAACTLREHSNIVFLICGEGMMKPKLIQMANNRKLKNIQFRPLVSYEELPFLLSLASVHLIPQKKAAGDLVLPSKLSTILASGGITIAAAEENTTLYDLINDNKIGMTIEPENSIQLVDAIQLSVKEDHSLLQIRARNYAENKLSKEAVLSDYYNKITNLMSQSEIL